MQYLNVKLKEEYPVAGGELKGICMDIRPNYWKWHVQWTM